MLIKPFKRKAKTKLIITGRRTSPNKRIKIKEVINKIAKYTDSSFEKNLSKNLLKKSSINYFILRNPLNF